MKRDFNMNKTILRQGLKWLLSFAVVNAFMLLGFVLLTCVQKKWRFDDSTLRLIITILVTVSAGACAYIYTRLSKMKGYLCGIITLALYSIIKLVMSVLSGGMGRANFMIYVCIICASFLGGILSANKRSRSKTGMGKMYKFNKNQ